MFRVEDELDLFGLLSLDPVTYSLLEMMTKCVWSPTSPSLFAMCSTGCKTVLPSHPSWIKLSFYFSFVIFGMSKQRMLGSWPVTIVEGPSRPRTALNVTILYFLFTWEDCGAHYEEGEEGFTWHWSNVAAVATGRPLGSAQRSHKYANCRREHRLAQMVLMRLIKPSVVFT